MAGPEVIQRWLRANWRGLLATLLLVPMVASLGVWQLQRGEQKREILHSAEVLREQSPLPLHTLDEPERYRQVLLEGEFDGRRYWLLDNRIRNGRFGYEVVGLFELTEGGQVLVNRGWVPGDRDRRRLPEVEIPDGELTLRGEVYRGHGQPFRLGAEEQADGEWPRRRQWLDIEAARRELGEQLRPFEVRLAPDQPGALQVGAPPAVNVQPERHIGYALQWFGIALVLLAIAGFRGFNSYRQMRED